MAVAKPILIRTRILDADRTALAADDADYTVNKGSKPNLIFVAQLDEEKGAYASTYTLMWKNTTDAGSFTDLAATGEINWAATTNLVQGTAVTARSCTGAGASGSTWQNGEEVEGAATCDSINLADEYYTEVHFAINISGVHEGDTYDFQVWENTGGTALAAAAAASLIVTSDQPSVVLNTTEAYEFATATPTLEFTGTDASDSDIRYNIQIDTVNTLDSQSPNMDSYSEANRDNETVFGTALTKISQSFTGNGRNVLSAQFYLKKLGSPPGTATAIIYDHSGDFGTSSIPTGGALITSSPYTVNNLTTSYQLITFTFPLPYETANGTKYCVALEYSGADASNHILVGWDGSSPSHGGNRATYSSGSWTPSGTVDLCFYVNQGTALIDKVSGANAGFANTVTPADTDPFNSGEKCDYDVQAGDALADATYYWRVRGLDPSPGSGSYGSWAATQSFIVNTGGGGFNSKIMVDGAWKAVSSANVMVDGAWKAVNSMKVMVDGAWKAV